MESQVSQVHGCTREIQLKASYSDGTAHVIFEPLEFIAKLAALVPKPRVNMTRFHKVFAPNSQHRRHVALARRGKGKLSITIGG
jgi:hypothetical protein